MNNIYATRPLRTLIGGALLLFATLAQAQYVWIDEKGLKQFSDRPPPPSVPLKNILKAPGQSAAIVSTEKPAADGDAAKPAAAAAKSSAPPTLADRNADYKKRAKEQAEKEAKAQAEAQDKQARKENCDAARTAKADLLSGVRFTITDKNGERNDMSDAQRAEQIARVNKSLENCN